MSNKKFNINIGNTFIEIDKESPMETLEYVTPPVKNPDIINLNVSKIKYNKVIIEFIRGILRENNIKVPDENLADEIAKNTYEHFITVLERENNIKINEIES